MTITTMTDELRERAQELGLHGLVAHFDELDDQAHRWLKPLLDWEETERRRRSLERRLKNAKLGAFKPLCDFDWSWPDVCDRAAVDALMKLLFVTEGANAILVGPNGVGKTMIAKNISHQGVLGGRTVRFVTAGTMLSDLASRETSNMLERRLRHYSRPHLLAIDEVGYLSYGNRHADLLFEVVSRRYEQGRSILVTTNKPFKEWNEIFPNAACVVTLVDRLVHKSDIVNIKGKSYRLKEAQERAARQARKRKTRKGRKRSEARQCELDPSSSSSEGA
jgi:DNA replication protein DnaC